MPVIILQPNDRKRLKTPAKYLNVIKASDVFSIDSPSYDLGILSLKQGQQVVLDNIAEIYLTNDTQTAITLDLQIANVRVFGGGAEAVEIVGSVVVSRIDEGVNVATSVGDVEILDANTYTENEDLVVAPNTKVMLLGADVNRKEAEIFIHGADFVTCRFGSTNITNTKGRIVTGGGVGVIGNASIKGTAALYIRNTDLVNSITVSLGAETRV